MADFGIWNALKARGAERILGEQRSKLKERHLIRREHIERIAEQLVRACAEMIEIPANFEKSCEFGDADEIGRRGFERIEAHRNFGVGGCDEHHPVREIPFYSPLLFGDRRKKKRRRIAVEIEPDESAPRRDILPRHRPQERALAAARLPEHGDMRCAARAAE